MSELTKEDLIEIQADHCQPLYYQLLAAFAARQMERAENAEKRMRAWGCPDEDFICLNCGRETPCMTEADLKPGDPGVPCTFDLTYPQMIERMHYHEDRQRLAEAERDRLKGELEEASGAIIWLAAVKMFNAIPPDRVSAAITRARERAK